MSDRIRGSWCADTNPTVPTRVPHTKAAYMAMNVESMTGLDNLLKLLQICKTNSYIKHVYLNTHSSTVQ